MVQSGGPDEDAEALASIRRVLESPDSITHYQLLQVLGSCTAADLQTAFHRFSENYHPDRHVKRTEQVRDDVRAIFKRGAEAYRVLKSPTLRKAYDLELATRTRQSSGSTRPRTLDELCQSPGGKLHARQADRAISEGRLSEAAGLLDKALRAEAENPELRERLAALRALLALQGDG